MFTTRLISSRLGLASRASAYQLNATVVPKPSAIHHAPTLRHMSTNSDNDNHDGYTNKPPADPSKLEMIRNWMKWDRWKYKPNLEAIANIGKGPSPLDAFRDMVPKDKRLAEPVGRSWTVKELRRKSYEDLHKLWYVLYKERNMLLTESNLSRRHGYMMVQPQRRKKVRKSMGAIKHVLGERKRAKIADHKLYLAELERFDGLMADLKLVEGSQKEDELEEAMHKESQELKLEKVD